ncbi:glycosyltransferase [Fluviispira multicolorata]|uniref:Glycosyltransferase n=1 Tax=Fluviispira multicolorata TaxID=2654512 RepID=A0A833JAJ0_9BACT|nr:glycosyltransferase [Fluviispira multicolorata]
MKQKTIFSLSGMGTIFTSKSIKSLILKAIIKKVYQFLFNGVKSKVIVQNNDDYNLLKNILKIKTENIILIKGSGVNPSDFIYLENDTISDIPIILLPARLIKEKGIFEISQASNLLNKKNIPHKIYIAGDIDKGNPSALLESEIKKIEKSSPSVKFIGYINNMKEQYKICTIVCLPSYREGLPKALLEAAASGRAIITCNVPGCKEVVEHNKNGILVPPQSSVELAKALKLLIENKELRNTLRKNMYQKFLNEFTEEKVVNDNIHLYDSFYENNI